MTPGVSQQVRWTIEDLEGFPDNSNRYKIIDGELFVTRSPHIEHQFVVGAVHSELRQWSSQSQLGMAAISPGIIFTEADAVIPDVIWISHDRVKALWKLVDNSDIDNLIDRSNI
jgi:Uma2 family endonuclease